MKEVNRLGSLASLLSAENMLFNLQVSRSEGDGWEGTNPNMQNAAKTM